MSSSYTLTIKNHTGKIQNYAFFKAPPVLNSDEKPRAPIWTNSIYTKDVPNDTTISVTPVSPPVKGTDEEVLPEGEEGGSDDGVLYVATGTMTEDQVSRTISVGRTVKVDFRVFGSHAVTLVHGVDGTYNYQLPWFTS